MKAMNVIKKVAALSLICLSAPAFAQSPSELVGQAKAVLQMMARNGAVQFASPESRGMYESALSDLERAQSQLASSSSSDLEDAIDEARFIQKVLASYLAEKEFHGYRLKRGAISFQVAGGAGYERAMRKMPWLGGMARVGAGGMVRVNPGEQIVTQFNSLKAEFYGALLQAASLNPADVRIRGLADWGRNTKVIYPGQTFGEDVLGFFEYVNLRLTN